MYKPLQIYKPPKRVTQKPSDKSPLQIQTPGGLYSEIALNFKIKQSKNCTVTTFFCICQRTITCAK